MPCEVTSPALLLTAWQLSCSSAGALIQPHARSPWLTDLLQTHINQARGLEGKQPPQAQQGTGTEEQICCKSCQRYFHLPPAAPALGRTFWVDFTLQSQQHTLTRVGRAHQLRGAHTGAFEAASVRSRNAPRHGWCWCCSLERQPWFCELAAMQKALRHCALP